MATVNRQERAAKRQRQAEAQAKTIITEATARATYKRCPVCRERGTVAELKAGGHGRNCTEVESEAVPCAECGLPVHLDEDGYAQDDAAGEPSGVEHECEGDPSLAPSSQVPEDAATCRAMREQGKSWMAIGAALGLPGAKSGAGAARKLYATHFGSYTETKVAPRARKERPTTSAGPKRDRKAAVAAGNSLISEELTDAQVVELVKEKTICWLIDLKRLAGGRGEDRYAEQEAKVHPSYVLVEPGKLGPDERCLRFRELLGYSDRGEPISGPTRTVRLAAIHTVR